MVAAGLAASALPVRVGRSINSPPQLGQRSSSASAQVAQKVHSNEQMNAPGTSEGLTAAQALSKVLCSASEPSLSPTALPLNLPTADMQGAAREMQALLLQGDREGAVEAAMDAGLWAPALLLASYLDMELYRKVMNRYLFLNMELYRKV